MSPDLVCSTCGEQDGTVRYVSGTPECGACWWWRKLDGPAARYWSERTEHLLEQIDGHDMSSYLPSVLGSQEAATEFIAALAKVAVRSHALRAQHGAPVHERLAWSIEAARYEADNEAVYHEVRA